MKSPNEQLFDKAISSKNLQNRALGNQQFASADFTLWVQELLESYPKTDVLDICCGTGNQLVIYAKAQLNSLAGLDISEESIKQAQLRLSDYQGDLSLTAQAMEEYLAEAQSNSKDFISSFYGLYYTTDIENTCQDIHRILAHKGHLLVCGPYGDNNESLFSLVTKYYPLPELVSYSSSTFMLQALDPILKKLGMTVEYKYFVNTISYPNTEALMSYLSSTTFFDENYAQKIAADIDNHFKSHTSFDVKKNVMALIATKQ